MDVVEENGEGDVVRIFLDEGLYLPAVGLFLALFVEVDHDLRSA